MAIMSSGGALAQAKQQMAPAPAAPVQPMPLKQMALSEKQIEGVLASQKDMDAITSKLSENAKPDPKVAAQLEGVAKKNGFASYDEYNDVVDNISMILGGFDSATKKYVGAEAVIKAQIAEVQAETPEPEPFAFAPLAEAPAPSAPELAAEVEEILNAVPVGDWMPDGDPLGSDPFAPEQLVSPHAHRPGNVVAPRRSVTTPPHW